MSKYRRQDLPNTNALERTAKIGTVAIAAMLLACSGCQTLPQNAPVGTAASSFERDLSIARLAERHGDETKARKIYQSVLAHDSSNQEALHRMGVIAAREGRMTDALTYVESAMVSGAPNAELLGDLGYVYYQQKKYNLAEDKLNESLDLDPRNERSLNNLGLTLAAQKKYRQALSLFEQVSTPAEALANLAYAQSQLGDLNAAESNYHLALEADPKTKVAAVGLIELRKHMRLNRARSFRQPEAMIARSEPQPPVQPHSVAAIESIKNREPSWRTNPVAPAPSRSPIVESTTPPETTIVHSQNTLSTRKQPSFETQPTLPPPTLQQPPPLNSVASIPAEAHVEAQRERQLESASVVTVSHTQDVEIEDAPRAGILNAPPPQPEPVQPATAEAPSQDPVKVVTAEWPDNLGLVLEPVE